MNKISVLYGCVVVREIDVL